MSTNEEQKAPISAHEILIKHFGQPTASEGFNIRIAMAEYASQEVSKAVAEKEAVFNDRYKQSMKRREEIYTELHLANREIEHLKLDAQMAHTEIDELKKVLLTTTEDIGFYMNETKKAMEALSKCK